jgi:hypothetical protein
MKWRVKISAAHERHITWPGRRPLNSRFSVSLLSLIFFHFESPLYASKPQGRKKCDQSPGLISKTQTTRRIFRTLLFFMIFASPWSLILLHSLQMIFANPYTKAVPSHHFFAGLCARLRYRLPDKLRHAISSLLDCVLILHRRVLEVCTVMLFLCRTMR